jgi:hypothetical protein
VANILTICSPGSRPSGRDVEQEPNDVTNLRHRRCSNNANHPIDPVGRYCSQVLALGCRAPVEAIAGVWFDSYL